MLCIRTVVVVAALCLISIKNPLCAVLYTLCGISKVFDTSIGSKYVIVESHSIVTLKNVYKL